MRVALEVLVAAGVLCMLFAVTGEPWTLLPFAAGWTLGSLHYWWRRWRR
jgi:hypothetical protein